MENKEIILLTYGDVLSLLNHATLKIKSMKKTHSGYAKELEVVKAYDAMLKRMEANMPKSTRGDGNYQSELCRL